MGPVELTAEGTGGVAGLGRKGVALASAGLLLVLFLVSLDQTIVSTAMPRIVAELDGFELYAWVTTSYLVAETVVIPIVGKLGDLWGRKWITVAGVFVFLVGSALSGFASTMTELIVFRGVQGLGGGMLLSTVFASLADIFPDPARRAKYQGLFFAAFALSSVIGPATGGFITDTLDWRWAFFVNLPLGLVSLLILPFALPQNERVRGTRIDYAGAATVTASVVALLLALSWVGQGYGWGAERVLIGFGIAAAFLAAFLLVEVRAPEPIIPLWLFRDRTVASASAVMFLLGIGFFGVILYVPLFVQVVLGQSATGSGAVLTPLILSMTIVGIVGGQLMARTGRVRPFLVAGTALMGLGIFLLSTLGTGSGTWTVASYLLVTGLGMGLIFPTTTMAVQVAVGGRMLGVATSATQFVRSVGAVAGAALLGSVVTGGYTSRFAENTPANAPEALLSALEDPDALSNRQALDALSASASQVPGGDRLVGELLGVARDSLSGAIISGFIVALVGIGLALVAAFLMKDLRLDDKTPADSAPGAAEEVAEGAVLPAKAVGPLRETAPRTEG